MLIRHRMVARTISTDEKVAMLSCPAAMLLWTWMIPHADNLGRMRGEAEHVRLTVMPRVKGVTAVQVGKWLEEMASLDLLQRYSADGIWVIQLKAWGKHQKMIGNMSQRSDLPEPSQGVYTTYERRSNGVYPQGEGEGEGKGEEEYLSDRGSDLSENFVRSEERFEQQCVGLGVPVPIKLRRLANRVKEHLDFPGFYGPYPVHVGRKAAAAAYAKARQDNPGLTAEVLLEALARYKLTKPPERAWAHASSWLNGERWTDELELVPQGRAESKSDMQIALDKRAAKEAEHGNGRTHAGG